MAVRVVHGAGCRGMRPAAQAEALARRLAHDRHAGVEHALHDGRVDVGDEALEVTRAVCERDAREADVVLQDESAAVQQPRWRALDARHSGPCVQRVASVRRGCDGPARVSNGG